MRSKDELMMQRLDALRSMLDLAANETKEAGVMFHLLERSTGSDSDPYAGKSRWIDDVRRFSEWTEE
jgi:hypothetical protein